MTPLMLAAVEGHSDCVKELLAAGCQKDARNNAGWTPLMFAAANGHVDCVRELLAASAQKEARCDSENNMGRTALMLATRNGHAACVEEFVAAGCEMPRGEEGLLFAAKAGKTDLVRELLQEGVDKEVADDYGRTPLMWAAKNSHADCVRALLAAGAQKEAKDSDGRTAAHFAKNEECVKLCLDEEVNFYLGLDSSPAMAGEPWRRLSAAYEVFRSSPHAASTIVSVALLGPGEQALLASRRPARDLPSLPASPGENFPGVDNGGAGSGHRIIVLVVGPSPSFVPHVVQEFRSNRAEAASRGKDPSSLPAALVVGITLGEGLGVFADLREEMLAAGIPCWT